MGGIFRWECRSGSVGASQGVGPAPPGRETNPWLVYPVKDSYKYLHVIVCTLGLAWGPKKNAGAEANVGRQAGVDLPKANGGVEHDVGRRGEAAHVLERRASLLRAVHVHGAGVVAYGRRGVEGERGRSRSRRVVRAGNTA